MTSSNVTAWAFIAFTLFASGCGHSKAEVDGLKADLEKVKAENARLLIGAKESSKAAHACKKEWNYIQTSNQWKLLYINYWLLRMLSDLPAWKEKYGKKWTHEEFKKHLRRHKKKMRNGP